MTGGGTDRCKDFRNFTNNFLTRKMKIINIHENFYTYHAIM